MIDAIKKAAKRVFGASCQSSVRAYNDTPHISFEEYQERAHDTSLLIERFRLSPNHVYAAIGLMNEAGEVGGVIKKGLRGDYGPDPAHSVKFREKLLEEVGDVLWYLSEICTQFGMDLEAIADANLAKLAQRAENGTLMTDGGER